MRDSEQNDAAGDAGWLLHQVKGKLQRRYRLVTESCNKAALTLKGTPKTWRTLDAAAKWVRGLGMGSAQIELARWQPGQTGLRL